MSTKSQKIQVTITVSQEFHKILEKVAKSYDEPIEKYVIGELIFGLDADLQADAGLLLGLKESEEYCDQLRALL